MDENQVHEPRIAILDPGVRTFQTLYDAQGFVMDIGKNDISRITRLCIEMDKLISCAASKETNHRKRYKLKKSVARMSKKIHDLISELHKKTCLFLCSNYGFLNFKHNKW